MVIRQFLIRGRYIQYLEQTYPEKLVFHPDAEPALFYKLWVERSILGLVFQCIVADMHGKLTEEDQACFSPNA